jgi:hypothetical protein
MNKLHVILLILPCTLNKLPTIPFVRMFVDDFHRVAQSFSWSVIIMIIGSFAGWNNFSV